MEGNKMKTVYRVIDKRTGEILFESMFVEDCEEYVVDNYCLFSTIITAANK